MADFRGLNLDGKIMTRLELKPFDSTYFFKCFKIMPRKQVEIHLIVHFYSAEQSAPFFCILNTTDKRQQHRLLWRKCKFGLIHFSQWVLLFLKERAWICQCGIPLQVGPKHSGSRYRNGKTRLGGCKYFTQLCKHFKCLRRLCFVLNETNRWSTRTS